MSDNSELVELWQAIARSGGIEAWVRAQLQEKGLLVVRQSTEKMGKRALSQYKKSLKAEAAERRVLKKRAWLAYKATHLVHLGEGVFWSDDADFDRFDLPDAEERVAENELPRLDKAQDLADALGISVAELRWLTFHREAARSVHYTRFTIPKRDGSERPIWAPRPKLKAAQRWILGSILERLPVHGAAHGFLPGRSTVSNARVHTDASVVVKLDLRDFFPTITWRRARGVFRKAGYREQIATLLALLCTESPREIVESEGETWFIAMGPRCLPQGAPTSPALTNVLSLRLDRRLAGLAKSLGWRYTRYADDLTFSLPARHAGPPRIGGLLGGVHRIVADEGFQVHPKKTRIMRDGARQKITGLVVNGRGTPRLTRHKRRQLRAMVHNLGQGKELREGESLEQLRGWIAYLSMTDRVLGAQLSRDLDAALARR